MSRMHYQILPEAERLFAPSRFDRELVTEFLFFFSRAEFALKAAGFAEPDRNDAPKMRWSSFADSLAGCLNSLNDTALADAYQVLNTRPPHRHVFKDGQLCWRPRRRRDGQSPEAFVIESVTTVRNNLFHGGKELTSPFSERDRELVRSALVVLAHAVSLHPTVRSHFGDTGPDRAAA